MGDLYLRALGEVQPLPGGFGEPNLVETQLVLAIYLEQGRLQYPSAARDEHLRAGGEPFRATNMTIRAHDDDWLVLRMQPQAPNTEGWLFGARRRDEGGHSSNT